MDNIPECMYDYRYDRFEANEANKIIGVCLHCENELYSEDEPYEIGKIFICQHCIEYFKRASEETELYL